MRSIFLFRGSGNGDFVDDTPPQSSASYGCDVGKDSCSGGGDDSIENYMDYSDDDCMNSFTEGVSFTPSIQKHKETMHVLTTFPSQQITRMQEQWNAYRADGSGGTGAADCLSSVLKIGLNAVGSFLNFFGR